MNIELKETRLHAIIKELGSVVVAFSAGADSTYLLAACYDVLGPERVLAVTACSATLPQQELEEAQFLAAHIGVRLEVITTTELEDPDFVRNDTNRCFHCQDNRFKTIWELARAHGLDTVVYGLTTNDLSDHRPGACAAQQQGVRAPLMEAGIGKSDIRVLSKRRGLPTYDKPSMACLASRIAYGSPITIENLDQVAEAEAFLKRELGLRQVRVRHSDRTARLEVEDADIVRLAQPGVRERIVAQLKELGFTYVTLDLAGFRSGSMNEGLNLI